MNAKTVLPLAIFLLAPCAAPRGQSQLPGVRLPTLHEEDVPRRLRDERSLERVYTCERKEFCIPGRSIRGETPCDCPGKCCRNHVVYKPTCGSVRERNVLVINEEKTQVPSYRCVVEEVCTHCGHCANRLDYPSADTAADAVVMVRGQGLEIVTDPEIAATLNAASDSTKHTTTVASRGVFAKILARQ